MATPLFVFNALSFMTDVPFLFWVVASLWCSLRGFRLGRARWVLAGSACAALAFLTRQLGLALPVVANAQVWPSAGWWQGFGNNELNTLITTAQKNNFDIEVALAQISQAKAQAEIAGAPLYPQISLGADASRSGGHSGGRERRPAACPSTCRTP